MTKSTRSRIASAIAVLLLGAPLACSFSKSSESSSDSSKGSSNSSKSSSGESSAMFRQDVEQYTAAYVEGGAADEASFFSGLGDLARERGISDWEAEPGAWESIGRGLARADLSDAQRSAYASVWAGDDAAKRDALERGTEASR